MKQSGTVSGPHGLRRARPSGSRQQSELRSVSRLATGALAGAVGTAAMDAVLYRRYRRAGGTQGPLQWEFSSSVKGWDDVSAPGLVGKELIEGVLGRNAPEKWARSVQNVTHWATGMSWSLPFALLAPTSRRATWTRNLGLGPMAWMTSYIVLPIAKVYKPIWDYDAKTLTKDLSAHLVYGITAGALIAAGVDR
jgi:hypothetical protein